jgi:Cof subfamily protein (haloacid dehalogenase superfamily)
MVIIKKFKTIYRGVLMAYRLIALDLDDTLLDNEGRIPERAMAAIRKACDKGIFVIVCTGRIRRGCIRYYEEMGLKTLLITSGGAEVYDNSGNTVFTKYLSVSCTKQLLSYAYDHGIHAQVYADGKFFVREQNNFSDLYAQNFGIAAEVVPDLIDRDIVTPKVLYIADEEKVPDIREAVKKEFPGLSIKRSNPTYLEFLDSGVSKGDALRFAAEYYGVESKDVIAIGDSEIDASMLEYAGLGVAVSNANSYAKEKADIICASNEEAGVADIIDKYLLEV